MVNTRYETIVIKRSLVCRHWLPYLPLHSSSILSNTHRPKAMFKSVTIDSTIFALSAILMYGLDHVESATAIKFPLLSVPNGYAQTISIGGDQEFTVMVTLRNSMFWVPSIDCRSCGRRHKFDPSLSSSFKPDGTKWEHKYWIGTVRGILGNDEIKGRIRLCYNCTFGMAKKMENFEDLHTDGMLGLSASTGTPFCRPFLFQTSYSFVIDFVSNPKGGAGYVTYGDSVGCPFQEEKVLEYDYLRESSYEFQVQLEMGDFKPFSLSATPELVPYIAGPLAIIEGIANCAGAEYIDGYYEVSCKDMDTIPDLIITDWITSFPITSDKLIRKIEGRCILALAVQSSIGFGPEIYFGSPLFEQYCVRVDTKTKTVVLARDKATSITTTLSRTCKSRTSSTGFPPSRSSKSQTSSTGFPPSRSSKSRTSSTGFPPSSSTQSTNTTEALVTTTKITAFDSYRYPLVFLILSLLFMY
ncbi:unnamed protein product [Cylicocyclus nassatus]|uniref:Peptidase A1 domain-containing protein n=1 Tax=Cylicocyclus nassatus TaxID=53992 RepID=A0AA36GIU0_CYLNA|nr:unnamed protein product [Cylicocyclus nassatus]